MEAREILDWLFVALLSGAVILIWSGIAIVAVEVISAMLLKWRR